ncbi:hypothetical protein Tco_1570396 [Tanacetum coccineum]
MGYNHQWRPSPTDPASTPCTQKLHSPTSKKNNEKALNILPSAIPDRHLLSFHDATNAKTLWTAIKARFGGNEASKKMQKNLLKQQFETASTQKKSYVPSLLKKATLPTTSYDEDLLQIDEMLRKEIDIRWQVASLTARIRKFNEENRKTD